MGFYKGDDGQLSLDEKEWGGAGVKPETRLSAHPLFRGWFCAFGCLYSQEIVGRNCAGQKAEKNGDL